MLVSFLRGLSDRFQLWTDALPEGPFEGSQVYAGAALAEKTFAHIAAEIDVTPASLASYAENGVAYLSPAERRRLRRFFSRRGVFEVRLPGVVGLVVMPAILRRAAAKDAEVMALAQRLLALRSGGTRG